MSLFKSAKSKNSYTNGLMAIIDGDYPLAIELLTKGCEEDHHNAMIFLVLGDIYRTVGLASRALNIHEPLVLRGNLSAPEKTKIYIAIAKDYEALSIGDKAVENYKQAVSFDNRNLKLLKDFFNLLKKLARWEEAYTVWESIRKLNKEESTDVLAYLETELAQTARDQGNLKVAEKKVRQALSLNAKCVPAKLLKGDLLLSNKKDEAAYKEWSEIVEIAPKLAFLAFGRLEKYFFQKNRYDKMLELYQKILQHCPECQETHAALAEFWIKRGNYTEAINQFTDAKNLRPDSLKITVQLIKLLLEQKMYDLAKNEIENLLTRHQDEIAEYSCQICRHAQQEFFFHCPTCGGIETTDGYF